MLSKIIKPVYAHCDLPCGIYETDTMSHAAATCLRMIEKIEEINPDDFSAESRNAFVRAVQIKEQHARIVKEQLATLWMDYFKPEHVERFPELHELVWQSAKQASQVKQHVSRESCEKLIEDVAKVAEVFAATKR